MSSKDTIENIQSESVLDSGFSGGFNTGADAIAPDSSDPNESFNSNSENQTQSEANEKIIKTVDLSIETKEFDTYLTGLTANVTTVGGYVENAEADYGRYSYSNRYATYIVRIPADKLDEFLSKVSDRGTIISKNEQQQNVTLEYVDVQSRIEAYKTEKVTLTNLLSKAESLADILSIQERLSEVNYQIDNYTSQLNVLENRVSYSTVTLRISEVERITESEPTLWHRIKERFSDNLTGLKEFAEDLLVSVVGGIPVLVVLFIIIIPAIIIIKRIKKKKHTIKTRTKSKEDNLEKQS
jgi:hypothetical protein